MPQRRICSEAGLKEADRTFFEKYSQLYRLIPVFYHGGQVDRFAERGEDPGIYLVDYAVLVQRPGEIFDLLVEELQVLPLLSQERLDRLLGIHIIHRRQEDAVKIYPFGL